MSRARLGSDKYQFLSVSDLTPDLLTREARALPIRSPVGEGGGEPGEEVGCGGEEGTAHAHVDKSVMIGQYRQQSPLCGSR